MKQMAIFSLSLIFFLPLKADTPNDCGLVAAEAYSRLHAAGVWAKILFVTYEDRTHHAFVVFSPSEQILVYDARGTKDLHTKSREIADIVAALKDWPDVDPIRDAHFIQ